MTTETEELDFSKICRVCCLTGKLLPLFKVHLNRKLMACTNISIWKDDPLPAQICSKCVSKLHIAYQFKKLCEKSDARLRNYLENVEATSQENEVDPKSTVCEPQVEEQQLHQPSLPLQNNYVFIECNPNVNSLQNGNTGLTSLVAQPVQTNALTYNLNPMGIVESLANNGYAIQHLNLPSATVQYQTYSVPMQIDHSNNLLPIAPQQIVPLQPVVNGYNGIINEPSTNNANKPSEVTHTNEINSKADNKNCQNKSCSTCGKVFPTAFKLSRHMKTHSPTITHRCKICHKGFSHGGNFKVHMRMHNDERPFSCPMCDHRCRQLQDLEKHKRKHNGERPYICRFCSKGFSTSSNLISHERIHTLEKPYVCSLCQKAFCQSNELTKHFRTHTREKSHTCKVCLRGFNGSSTLTVHMRSHTGEKPHVCHHCKKGFAQSSCLKVHLKKHYNEDKNFQCSQCPSTFFSQSSLKTHVGLHDTGDKVLVSIK